MKRVLVLLALSAGLASGCGDDDSDQRGDLTASDRVLLDELDKTETGAARVRRGPLVKLKGSQFGRVLFDGRDRALYLFTRDGKGKSRCYGACAEAWPPFYARGRPRAGRGVRQALLGTTTRRDGRRQVTYKGQPLYFYVDDPKGQVLCNDVAEFGGTWFALDAAGNPPA
jgi:predicted lipoprotein with Yx(FWY)xxD motif